MVGVQLNHEIIIGVAIMVIKESKIALFAPGPARPTRPMIVHPAFSGGNHHAVFTTPPYCFRRWILVRKPGVMRIVLMQHGFQGFPNKWEGLGWHLGYNHSHPG